MNNSFRDQNRRLFTFASSARGFTGVVMKNSEDYNK